VVVTKQVVTVARDRREIVVVQQLTRHLPATCRRRCLSWHSPPRWTRIYLAPANTASSASTSFWRITPEPIALQPEFSLPHSTGPTWSDSAVWVTTARTSCCISCATGSDCCRRSTTRVVRVADRPGRRRTSRQGVARVAGALDRRPTLASSHCGGGTGCGSSCRTATACTMLSIITTPVSTDICCTLRST